MRAKFIWMNGRMPTALGTSVFEGLRAYEVGGNAVIFCGPEHFERHD